jgi:hypothetical protein
MNIRHLRCLTCWKRATYRCKTIIIGQKEDFRGIELYTRINGCASHSDINKVRPSPKTHPRGVLPRKDWETAAVVGAEQIAGNTYKVWYQPYKNGAAFGDQFHTILTKREYEFTRVRDTLLYDYCVPSELIDQLVYTAESVKEEKESINTKNGVEWR